MRAFAWFLASLVAAALLGALIAYPAYELTRQLGAPWPFHRVDNRVTLLVLLAMLVWVSRRLGLTRARDFGYDLPWRRCVRVALLFGLIGIGTATLGAAFLLATHLRTLTAVPALTQSSLLQWLRFVLTGLGSGVAVALIEESVMRGGLHTAIARESGEAAAALTTAPLFALLHFFAHATIAPAAVDASSGFVLLRAFFSPWAHPALILDAFLAWLAVGLLLSLTRIWSGNIAPALGLHAGWVLVLRVLQLATGASPGGAFAPWVGRFDGLLGYWVLPWALLIALGLAASRAAWLPQARAAPASEAMPSRRASGSSSSR